MRAEERRLEAGDGEVAGCQVRDRLDPGDALDRRGGHEAAHARARAWVVVHVDDVDVTRFLELACELEHRVRVAAARGVDLDRDCELARAQLALQRRLALGSGAGESGSGSRTTSGAPGRRRSSIAARIAAISVGVVPQQPPTIRAPSSFSVCREVGEVARGRVREHDPAPGEARKPDVRHRRQRLSGAPHPLESAQSGLWARAVVRSDRGDVGVREFLRCPFRREAAERSASSSKVSSATIGSAEALRTSAIALCSSSRS